MILDSKLNFEEHLRAISTKVNKNIGLLRRSGDILFDSD